MEKPPVVKSYRDLLVWQKGIDLAELIYRLTESFPRHELYGLANQLRRAAVSVSSNISEGQTRSHTKEFVQFLYIALGSLSEIDTQVTIAHRLRYITDEQCAQISEDVLSLRKMIYSLIKHLPDPS